MKITISTSAGTVTIEDDNLHLSAERLEKLIKLLEVICIR